MFLEKNAVLLETPKDLILFYDFTYVLYYQLAFFKKTKFLSFETAAPQQLTQNRSNRSSISCSKAKDKDQKQRRFHGKFYPFLNFVKAGKQQKRKNSKELQLKNLSKRWPVLSMFSSMMFRASVINMSVFTPEMIMFLTY